MGTSRGCLEKEVALMIQRQLVSYVLKSQLYNLYDYIGAWYVHRSLYPASILYTVHFNGIFQSQFKTGSQYKMLFPTSLSSPVTSHKICFSILLHSAKCNVSGLILYCFLFSYVKRLRKHMKLNLHILSNKVSTGGIILCDWEECQKCTTVLKTCAFQCCKNNL